METETSINFHGTSARGEKLQRLTIEIVGTWKDLSREIIDFELRNVAKRIMEKHPSLKEF